MVYGRSDTNTKAERESFAGRFAASSSLYRLSSGKANGTFTQTARRPYRMARSDAYGRVYRRRPEVPQTLPLVRQINPAYHFNIFLKETYSIFYFVDRGYHSQFNFVILHLPIGSAPLVIILFFYKAAKKYYFPVAELREKTGIFERGDSISKSIFKIKTS